MPAPQFAVISLYRSYLRQVRLLPVIYLRQFFRIKATHDIRSILNTGDKDGLRYRKMKRASKDLQKLRAALGGDIDAFQHILDVAYGRKGSLRWYIMKPILSDPNAPPAARIIPSYEKSRPPVYSPELTALLTSTHSRTTKALEKGNLKSPPSLPARVDPFSKDAQLLGPLSKRREVNLRWRYFTKEWHKVLPPVQLSVKELSESGEVVCTSTDAHDVARAGVRGVGLSGTRILEEVQNIAGPAWKPLSTPRRTRREAERQAPEITRECFDSDLPTRWVRKRYQNLLGRMPILTYSYQKREGEGYSRGRYEVTLDPSALSSHIRYTAHRLPPIDESNLSWIKYAGAGDGGDAGKPRRIQNVHDNK